MGGNDPHQGAKGAKAEQGGAEEAVAAEREKEQDNIRKDVTKVRTVIQQLSRSVEIV
jgi:hypothetical protein